MADTPLAAYISALSWTDDDRRQIGDRLFLAKRTVYLSTLNQLAKQYDQATTFALSASVSASLRRDADRQARRIVAHHNAALGEFLTDYASRFGPLTRDDLIHAYEEWAIGRGERQADVVGVTEAYSPHADATMAFFIAAGELIEFDFGGHGDAPPECVICQALVDGNPWPMETVIEIGVPHINCRQEWHAHSPPTIELPADVTIPAVAGIVGPVDTFLHRHESRSAATDLVTALASR